MAGFNMMALMNTASQSEAAKTPYELKTLPIDVIIPNPANHYSMAGIDELADSIMIAGRVLQNIAVKEGDVLRMGLMENDDGLSVTIKMK